MGLLSAPPSRVLDDCPVLASSEVSTRRKVLSLVGWSRSGIVTSEERLELGPRLIPEVPGYGFDTFFGQVFLHPFADEERPCF